MHLDPDQLSMCNQRGDHVPDRSMASDAKYERYYKRHRRKRVAGMISDLKDVQVYTRKNPLSSNSNKEMWKRVVLIGLFSGERVFIGRGD